MNTLNSHVIDLLSGELGFVIGEAEQLAENLNTQHFQTLRDAMKQLHGICVIAGLDSLSRLSEEIVLSIDAAMADRVDREALKVLLQSSLTAASKLAKAIVDVRKDNACILLPEMTALRRLRGEPPLYEYHCLNKVSWPEFDKKVASNPLGGEQKDDVKRLLHLYQFGLLDVIRDNNRNKAFIILFRVAQRLQNIAVLVSEKDYWWVVGLVVRALAENKLELQVERIRLLAVVEKQIRLLTADNPGDGRNPYPEGLWRAFVSLVALIETKDSEERERRIRVGIPELGFFERDISEIRKFIIDDEGRDEAKVFRSLKDLIWNTRYVLDIPENGHIGGDSSVIVELQEAFDKMASLWQETGFDGLSRRFKQFSTKLESSEPGAELSQELMVEFIDTILQSECALLEFDYIPPSKIQAKEWESRPLSEILQVSLLKTAQVAVMNESGTRLAEVKEILSEISSGYVGDETLPELESALLAISGSAHLVQFTRLADLTSKCLRFVKEILFSEQTEQLVENYWEVFADSITCLEYYIDNCKSGYREDETALDLANECLLSLGVE
jgi:HPt (histidine-containing phosphotransfer) domain-containing protein